ncbi:MAG: hypothetical protein HOE44_07945 [Candidatus Marinimicrobia bacterium]|nr:hypothetical protein [Candidatus Neomarinimicrobiota bacterium]MBT5268083.1 hypothetical protein [Candidatus Neomarinimicrobiota bacterium]
MIENKLPYILVWLDWCVYSYWISLIVMPVMFGAHYLLRSPHPSASGLSLAIFVSVCAWVTLSWMRQGYAVG